jgi:hypothetical protein
MASRKLGSYCSSALASRWDFASVPPAVSRLLIVAPFHGCKFRANRQVRHELHAAITDQTSTTGAKSANGIIVLWGILKIVAAALFILIYSRKELVGY